MPISGLEGRGKGVGGGGCRRKVLQSLRVSGLEGRGN